MWDDEGFLNMLKMFLPPTSQVILLDTPCRKPAVYFVDIDGDNILELAVAYRFQGEIYIVILKYYNYTWYVMDTIKGKGYNITYFGACPITSRCKNNLIVGWQVGAIWSDLSVYELVDTKLKELVDGNKYFSKIEVVDIESTAVKNGTCELALWSHDTGKAYRVEIYRWSNNKFELALDAYPCYFKKVANYYKKILKESDSTTYWYYLADAQIKICEIDNACRSIDKALSFEYPYPSIEKLTELKKQICGDIQLSNKYEIDFSSIKYISSETKKDVQLEKAIVKAFNLSQDVGNIRYYYNKVDLNDDGNPEVFVYLVGPYVCGTGGCSAAIFKNVKKEYSVISTFSLVNNPIIISNKKTNGYKDLIMHVSGGGIESFFAEIKYDGTTYPSNPSIQPKVKMGTKVEGIAIISDDITKNPGILFTNLNRTDLNNKKIVDVKMGNVIGKNTLDKVTLVGNYPYKDSSYVENVDIVINPEGNGSPIVTKISYTGYNLELFLGDFDGDSKEEIMLIGEYGGSGGYAVAVIYKYNEGRLVEIFNPDMFSQKYKFSAKYLDGYKVLVQSLTLKENYIFDISKTPEIYLNMIYDKNGKVKDDQKPSVSAINGAYPIKIASQKNYSLFIRQRIIGASNAHRIGYIESFVSLLNDDIKVIQMGAYHFGEK